MESGTNSKVARLDRFYYQTKIENAIDGQWLKLWLNIAMSREGDVCSFRILVSVEDKPDDSIRYLEKSVKKLVVLAENENDNN